MPRFTSHGPFFKDFHCFRKKVMVALGAEVTEVSLPALPQQCAAYYVNVLSEASANLARFDGIRYG